MRYNTLRNGNRGAVTPAQLARLKMAKYDQSYSDAATGLSKYEFTITTSDYVADGSLFKLVLAHPINSLHYVWSVVKTDNSAGVIVENFAQRELELTLWFTDDTLALAITIIG